MTIPDTPPPADRLTLLDRPVDAADPLALRAEHAFDARIFFERRWQFGPVGGGAMQHFTSIGTGSTIDGPLMKGRIVDHGGADWPVARPDGVVELNAHYTIETNDGVQIYLRNQGYVHGLLEREGGALPPYFRCTPYFRAPLGRYAWLNRKVLVGIGQRQPQREPGDPPDHSLFRYYVVL